MLKETKKECKVCGETKSLDAFNKHKCMRLGVHHTCKACQDRIAVEVALDKDTLEKVNRMRRLKPRITFLREIIEEYVNKN